MMPVRQLMVVLLPAPLGPSRQNSLSFSTVNHEPWEGKKKKRMKKKRDGQMSFGLLGTIDLFHTCMASPSPA